MTNKTCLQENLLFKQGCLIFRYLSTREELVGPSSVQGHQFEI